MTQNTGLEAMGCRAPTIRPKRTTRMWNKAQTQETIKALRAAGYKVEKDTSGIYRLIFDDIELFVAMPGTRGYLISYAPKLFDENAPLEV